MIDRKGKVNRQRWRKKNFFQEGRHRRLAKAGSPATARVCGELWRALLAAAVAVAAPRSDFDEVLSFIGARDPLPRPEQSQEPADQERSQGVCSDVPMYSDLFAAMNGFVGWGFLS